MPNHHRGWGISVILGLAVALATAGCGQSLPTRLPDLAPPPPPRLSAEQQKQAVADLNQKNAAHEAEAVKEIEQAR